MHKLQVKWQDGRQTNHEFDTIEKFLEYADIAKLLNASMRFLTDRGWTRWS